MWLYCVPFVILSQNDPIHSIPPMLKCRGLGDHWLKSIVISYPFAIISSKSFSATALSFPCTETAHEACRSIPLIAASAQSEGWWPNYTRHLATNLFGGLCFSCSHMAARRNLAKCCGNWLDGDNVTGIAPHIIFLSQECLGVLLPHRGAAYAVFRAHTTPQWGK